MNALAQVLVTPVSHTREWAGLLVLMILVGAALAYLPMDAGIRKAVVVVHRSLK